MTAGSLIRQTVSLARAVAAEDGCSKVSGLHILCGAFEVDSGLARQFAALGILNI